MPRKGTQNIWNKEYLDICMRAQSGIPARYSTKSYQGEQYQIIEEQSAALLDKYASGVAVLEPGCDEILEKYFSILERSNFPGIVFSLQKAKDRFKKDIITKHKNEEKRKAFLNSQFKILNNKKQAVNLSSEDMLMIAELLETVKEYSTSKMKDKLRGFAMEKIKRTLKGKTAVDKNFEQLMRCFGTVQDRAHFSRFTAKQQTLTAQKENKSSVKKDKKSRFSFTLFKNSWRHIKRASIVAGIAVLGYFGTKFAQNEFSKMSDSPKKNPSELLVKTQKQTPAPNIFSVVKKTEKSADNINKNLKIDETKKEIVNKKPASSLNDKSIKETSTKTSLAAKDSLLHEANLALEKAYKNKFDSSLKILLGEKARDELYKKIDELHKEGKIQYSVGTNREWYAHAFTMYDKLAPYSEDNKTIKNLLAGKPVDASHINTLVLSSKRDGTGIKASGKYSAFDNAPKAIKQEHIRNIQAVTKAQIAMANLSRCIQ